MSQSVLVVGASGNVGRHLLSHLAGRSLSLIVTEHKRAIVQQSGVIKRQFAWDNPEKWPEVFEGVETIFLCVPFHQMMVERATSFLRMAHQHGVRRVIKLSAHAASAQNNPMAKLHHAIDGVAMALFEHVTVLQCNGFMQNYTGFFRAMLQRGVLKLPYGKASMALIDTFDVAEVVAELVVSSDASAPVLINLDGPEALCHEQISARLSRIVGRSVVYSPCDNDRWRATLLALGIDPWRVDVLCGLDSYLASGAAAGCSVDWLQYLGRSPTNFSECIRRELSERPLY